MQTHTPVPVRPLSNAGREEIIPIRPGGTKDPLFLIDGHASPQPWLTTLAAYIDDDTPVYGVPCRTLGNPGFRTVERLASHLGGVLRKVRPQGPYRLAGWGLGGIVAYEVAIQLLGQDLQVDFVGLVNSGRAGPANGWDMSAPGNRQDCQPASRYALDNYATFPLSVPVHLFIPQQEGSGHSAPDSRWRGWGAVLLRTKVERVDAPTSGLSITDGDVGAVGPLLAKALLEADSERMPAPELEYRPHMMIQRGTHEHPAIVCIPGAGDSVINFLPLAGALGPAWPVHGLQPRGVDGEMAPHTTVQAAADAYLETIDTVRAETGKPVHLVGHSFGGWIALEIASRLQARGQMPASLTLIDSEAPGSHGVLGRPYTFTEILQKLVEALEHSTGKTMHIPLHEFERVDEDGKWRLLHEGMIRIGLMHRRSRPADLAGLVRTYGTALRTEYLPERAYAGPVRLALADDHALDEKANLRAHHASLREWQRSAPLLSAWRGPGNHYTILKQPHVGMLANWWREIL